MPNKLSHSSVSKFQDCPTAWKFHYVDRLRPVKKSAALFFGSAIDAALTALMKERMLVQEGKTITDPVDPYKVFDYHWHFQPLNDKTIELRNTPDIVYSNSDFDKDLLLAEDWTKIQNQFKLEDPYEEIKKLYGEKETVGWDNMPDDRKLIFNTYNWHCMHRKGVLMIQAFYEKVLPLIEHVYSVQEKIVLPNADGDQIIGWIDIVVKLKGYKDPVVLDWKTSMRDYDEDVVLTAPQLTLYVFAVGDKYGTRNAGFIVFKKTIIKNKTKYCAKCQGDGTKSRARTCDKEVNEERCHGEWVASVAPEADVKFYIDEVPQQTENIVMENMSQITTAISNGTFIRNFQSCVKPWGKCQYFAKCFKESDEGLIIVQETQRKEDDATELAVPIITGVSA